MYSTVLRTVTVMTFAAVFASTGYFTAAAQTSGSKVAAQPSITVPLEKQSDSTGTLVRGAKAYATSCQPCHGNRKGKGRSQGADPHNEKGHSWHHPDSQIKEWIRYGKPGPRVMPGFKDSLSDDDIEAILAYIKTWWTAEQREIQADISKRFQEALEKQKKGRK